MRGTAPPLSATPLASKGPFESDLVMQVPLERFGLTIRGLLGLLRRFTTPLQFVVAFILVHPRTKNRNLATF
jgi:hypothetical protein